jgi:uncharacterized coiled-coil protein SlyX
MIVRTIRTIGLTAALGAAGLLVAGPASAAPAASEPKSDCAELVERSGSLTAERNALVVERNNAQAKVAQLEPIVTYQEYLYGGFNYSITTQTAYIQHLIDIGAPATDIAMQEAELLRLTALRDQQTPAIVALRQNLADARTEAADVQQKLTTVTAALKAVRQLIRKFGCPAGDPKPRR